MTDREALFALARREMLELIGLQAGLVSDRTGKPALAARVLARMGAVPRHAFVPTELQPFAYADAPLPIGFGKTVSQPFIIALMTDLLDLQPTDRVLEVGTGLGYHAAILAGLAATVYSVEIIEELARDAADRLAELGCDNIVLKIGDGSVGWSQQAPFDKILVTAAPELIPAAMLRQLQPGGKMVIPAGLADEQQLLLVEKDADGATAIREILAVRFAPLIVSH